MDNEETTTDDRQMRKQIKKLLRPILEKLSEENLDLKFNKFGSQVTRPDDLEKVVKIKARKLIQHIMDGYFSDSRLFFTKDEFVSDKKERYLDAYDSNNAKTFLSLNYPYSQIIRICVPIEMRGMETYAEFNPSQQSLDQFKEKTMLSEFTKNEFIGYSIPAMAMWPYHRDLGCKVLHRVCEDLLILCYRDTKIRRKILSFISPKSVNLDPIKALELLVSELETKIEAFVGTIPTKADANQNNMNRPKRITLSLVRPFSDKNSVKLPLYNGHVLVGRNDEKTPENYIVRPKSWQDIFVQQRSEETFSLLKTGYICIRFGGFMITASGIKINAKCESVFVLERDVRRLVPLKLNALTGDFDVLEEEECCGEEDDDTVVDRSKKTRRRENGPISTAVSSDEDDFEDKKNATATRSGFDVSSEEEQSTKKKYYDTIRSRCSSSSSSTSSDCEEKSQAVAVEEKKMKKNKNRKRNHKSEKTNGERSDDVKQQHDVVISTERGKNSKKRRKLVVGSETDLTYEKYI